MSKRRPGRPPDTPQKRLRLALTAQTFYRRGTGRDEQAVEGAGDDRAASRLKVSAKTVRRRLATLEDPDELTVIDGGTSSTVSEIIVRTGTRRLLQLGLCRRLFRCN